MRHTLVLALGLVTVIVSSGGAQSAIQESVMIGNRKLTLGMSQEKVLATLAEDFNWGCPNKR